MAAEIYFLFWPSLILSVLGSIILTAAFYLISRRNAYSSSDPFYGSDGLNSNEEDSSSNGFESGETQIKTGGMIMVGPIPIVFGNDGMRFDKKNFKYALLFFLIAVLIYLAAVWIISQ
ncbi:TIGR00304 family membrane protein [Methanolapillus millepedarum]|uniref:DUF131 domain-containing protein n=1 Tax=Methanolapillus millepedarum TaxID=3028296 RepID=A0AA96V4J4_9EURY|nr:hypothetical protein MsAc7_04000 [Methanosarcinaceae archaeon Ac7]